MRSSNLVNLILFLLPHLFLGISLAAENDEVLKSLAQEEKQLAKPVKPTAPDPASAPVPAPTPTSTSTEPTTANASVPAPTAPTSLLEKYNYIVENRRDPFSPYIIDGVAIARRMVNLSPKTPLEKFELEDLRLSAILWNVSRPKAMIRDPQGSSHIVVPNQRIGRNNGYVAAIREGELVVVEPLQEEGRVVFSTKLMRIQHD